MAGANLRSFHLLLDVLEILVQNFLFPSRSRGRIIRAFLTEKYAGHARMLRVDEKLMWLTGMWRERKIRVLSSKKSWVLIWIALHGEARAPRRLRSHD